MFSAIRDVLSSSLLFWEVAGYICTGIVILGCAGEYIAEFTRLPKTDDRKHRISKLSLIILTFGIAGELLTAIRSSQISGQVIADLQTSVKTAKQSASDAADAAERARRAADGAEGKAEAVGKEADAAAIKVAAISKQSEVAQENLNLLRENSMRRSVSFPFDKFTAHLKSKSELRTHVEILYKPNDAEAFEFAERLFIAFGQAGWTDTSFPSPIPENLLGPAIGVFKEPSVIVSEGVTVMARSINETGTVPENTPLLVLDGALSTGQFVTHATRDITLPDNALRLVVGSEEHLSSWVLPPGSATAKQSRKPRAKP